MAAVTPEHRTSDPVGLLRLPGARYADVPHEIRTVMRREVDRLCNETRLCADEQVDVFGIPEEVLAAPIGLSDPGSGED